MSYLFPLTLRGTSRTFSLSSQSGGHERHSMATQTRTALDSNIVAQTLVSRYGVSGLAADVTTIEWAVDRALKTHAPAAVKTALSRLNSKRVAMGKMPSYPRYGHPLF